MNITVFSGGTGSIALQKGLKTFFPNCKITNIINGYDDGKSTGVCRKLFGTLGASDIRKNQYTQYTNSVLEIDLNIQELFENRFDFNLDNMDQVENVFTKNREFWPYIQLFCKYAEDNDLYEFKDFNLANIVYSAMFKIFGYEYTIEYFNEYFDIKDNIVLSSFSNSVLQARTESGKLLETEASIVEHKSKDKINEIFFENETPKLNHKVLDILEESDLIILSSGTQWSSLIPTYFHKEIGHALQTLNIPQMLIINNNEDYDMLGVNLDEQLMILEDYLPMQKLNILVNLDACESLNSLENKSKYSVSFNHYENNNGKHNSFLLGRDIFKNYIKKVKPNRILFDFDDTLFSRDINKLQQSQYNIKLLDKLCDNNKVSIVSGNSFKSIKEKLGEFDINKLEYFITSGGVYDNIALSPIEPNLVIYEKDLKHISRFLPLDIKIENRSNTCYSIKPVLENRTVIVKNINEYFYSEDLNYIAYVSGLTTIDIMRKDSNKLLLVNKIGTNFMFIGDEIFEGNDKEISEKGEYRFPIFNINETTELILELLNEI